jgi:HSP20 family protein
MITRKERGLAGAAAADPVGMLRQATAEIDRMFNQEYRWPALAHRILAKAATWYPEIDVLEEEHGLVVKADLPGMKKDDVKVEVIDGQLTIAGERKTVTDEKKHSFYRCERAYGSFYRTIPLPAGIAVDDVTAAFADGVLEVRVPLPPPAVGPKPKPVRVEGPATSTPAA